MQKYLIQKTIEAEPMLRTEAEARLGREIDAPIRETVGYLSCDMDKLKWDWVPQNNFEGKPFNTPLEQLMVFSSQLEYWQRFFSAYNKNKTNISQQERLQIYKINRHMEFFADAIKKVININQIKQAGL